MTPSRLFEDSFRFLKAHAKVAEGTKAQLFGHDLSNGIRIEASTIYNGKNWKSSPIEMALLQKEAVKRTVSFTNRRLAETAFRRLRRAVKGKNLSEIKSALKEDWKQIAATNEAVYTSGLPSRTFHRCKNCHKPFWSDRGDKNAACPKCGIVAPIKEADEPKPKTRLKLSGKMKEVPIKPESLGYSITFVNADGRVETEPVKAEDGRNYVTMSGKVVSPTRVKKFVKEASMGRQFNRFSRGAGKYTCSNCGKQTRDTGYGEASLGYCKRCFVTASVENVHVDNEHPGAFKDCAECKRDIALEMREKLKENMIKLKSLVQEDMKPGFEQQAEKYVAMVQQKMNDYWKTMKFTHSKPPQVGVTKGGRYWRVFFTDGSSRGVHSFLDTTTGDILKGSWKAPVKNGVRGNIFSADLGAREVNHHGPNYLR